MSIFGFTIMSSGIPRLQLQPNNTHRMSLNPQSLPVKLVLIIQVQQPHITDTKWIAAARSLPPLAADSVLVVIAVVIVAEAVAVDVVAAAESQRCEFFASMQTRVTEIDNWHRRRNGNPSQSLAVS